jgi:hypothetical protein
MYPCVCLAIFQIGHFTLDSTKDNATAMKKLESLLNDRELPFNALSNRVQCLANIITICSSRVIAAFSPKSPTNASLLTLPSTDEPGVADLLVMELWDDSDSEYDPDPDSDLGPNGAGDLCDLTSRESKWSAGLERNPLNRARSVIRALWASEPIKQRFSEAIEDGNERGWFPARDKYGKLIPGETAQVKNVPVLRDIKTRWDSVYLMLRRLRELRGVSFH